MSRKSKIDPVLKIKAVEDILVGKNGVCEVARERGYVSFSVNKGLS